MNNFLNPNKIISETAIGKGTSVADFGFGSGTFLSALSREVGEDGKVFAFDIQEQLVKKISKDFFNSDITNIQFSVTDLEKEKSTKLKDESIDFILISSLFFQIEQKNNVIKEAFRVLKPNGRLLFIDWKESFSGIGPDQGLIFSEIEAVGMFETNTFNLERKINSGKYHYALLFRKIAKR